MVEISLSDDGLCVIKGCDIKAHGHGMCTKHLTRWRRYGDVRRRPTTPAIRAKGYTLEERFWSKVDKAPGQGPNGDCWEWKAPPSHKYGSFGYQGKVYSAHRLGWELINGPMDANLLACHTCDNPRCVRPDHIFPGTPLENMQDMWRKGRARMSPPPVLRGERNNHAKMTDATVREMRRRRKNGEKLADLAKAFGVDWRQVWKIVARRSWKHVTDE